tara:strand:+ start:128 stop:406 length:279 start_codon:yes stop_codon:yes gene_type:complete
MDEKILKILHDKLDEIFVKNDEIRKITSSIDVNTYLLDPQSLWLGILIGRLYNSFYYQHRRVLDRNPTTDEFVEFVDFIKSNQKNFQKKLGF